VDFLRQIPVRILQSVQTVCCDLWKLIESRAGGDFRSRIVADRFHVARHLPQRRRRMRKTRVITHQENLVQRRISTTQWQLRAFRKNARDLNKEERKNPETLFRAFRFRQQAYVLREQLTAHLREEPLPSPVPNPPSCIGSRSTRKRLALFR